MKKLLSLALLSMSLWSANVIAAQEWIYGDVTAVEDFAAWGNGSYQVLITMSNMKAQGGGAYSGPCNSGIFKVVLGQNGIDSESKNRIFSLALSSYVATKPFGLYVENTTPDTCSVIIGRIGPNK